MRSLLNRPEPTAVVAGVVALLSVLVAPVWAEGFYKQSYAGVPGTAFTLLGFLVAAVTILLTIRDRPFLQALQAQRPELWKQVINEFFLTSYLIAAFGLVVMVFGWQYPAELALGWKRLFLFSYIALFALSALQMAKTIYVLHAIAKN
ncbi:hypothetical protein [Deinococcus fonticola]|uniref:hypothetical protein n=1 Tax=Deinococcus fonticola TaxID=2528713 RepID=UPI001075770A|nr:hypothetical protein [Deinococcus fonticola]